MSNYNNGLGPFNNGIGREDDDDTSAISPLRWRSGGQQGSEQRFNQYPDSERLNFSVGNDPSAFDYAQSLNALNAAFGDNAQAAACLEPTPLAPDCHRRNSNQSFASSGNAAALAPTSDFSQQQGASNNFLFQWQQPAVPAASAPLSLEQTLQQAQAPLDHSLHGIPQRRSSDATAASHDSQGHVQGMFGSKKAKTLLPVDFKPSNNSVILGRGRCAESIGNRRFKVVVQDHLQEYLDAPGKLEKTFIVSKVLNTIEQTCPVGAFVKFENGRWWSAGERASREKIGASFRDALHTLYKSSSKSKVAKRKAKAEAEKKQPPK